MKTETRGRKKLEYPIKQIRKSVPAEVYKECINYLNNQIKQFKTMKTTILSIALALTLFSCSTPEIEETNPKAQTNLNCQCATILRTAQFTLIGSPKTGSETGWITRMTIENNCDRVQETLTVKGYYKVGEQYCK